MSKDMDATSYLGIDITYLDLRFLRLKMGFDLCLNF